jgi:hypothetical protein
MGLSSFESAVQMLEALAGFVQWDHPGVGWPARPPCGMCWSSGRSGERWRLQQPTYQGGHNGRELRHDTFLRGFECGASWTAVALYLPPKAKLVVLFWASGCGLGGAQRRRGGRSRGGWGGGAVNFAQLLGGRLRASGPARRAK